MNKNIFAISFGLCLLLAGMLQFYCLDKLPPALNLDEVVMGYDDYSILKTGRDQYGHFLPVYFQSHDDYKPPFIIYSQVLSIAILGLTDFAVRFPSAVFGLLAVVMTFLLTKELLGNKKAALVAALLFAFSPWHLQFSRTAYEVGIQPFLTTTALYLFIKGIKSRGIWQGFFSGVFFGLGTHLYTASRVFVPLFVGVVGLLQLRDLLSNKKFLVWLAIGFLILFIPTVYLFTTPAGQVRFKGTNIFNDPAAHSRNLSWQIDDWLRRDRISASLFHSEKLTYLPEILYGYFVHLRPDFIYLGNTDGSTNYVPKVGLEYLWELPFLAAGFFYLFARSEKKPAILLLSWILLAPVPASVTYGIPTSIRVAIILPALQIVTAYGIVKIFRWKFIGAAILTLIVGIQLAYYLHMYYIHAPVERSQFWYPSYRQVAVDAKNFSEKYSQVIVSTSLDQPQSFFLYYLKYDPATYLSVDGGTISGSYAETRNHFGKFSFKPIKWEEMKNLPGTLFVGRPSEFPSDAPIIKKYFYLNGKEEVYLVGRSI